MKFLERWSRRRFLAVFSAAAAQAAANLKGLAQSPAGTAAAEAAVRANAAEAARTCLLYTSRCV